MRQPHPDSKAALENAAIARLIKLIAGDRIGDFWLYSGILKIGFDCK